MTKLYKLHFSTEDSYCHAGLDFYFTSEDAAETFAQTETANHEDEIYHDYGMSLNEYFEEVSPWWIDEVEPTTIQIYK